MDILYLVCHGALEYNLPYLLLEKADGTGKVVDGRKLVERFSELERRPTIVMLCSCQSASSGNEVWSEDQGELSALGPRLALAGVAAVIAMQGNISMTTVETFAPAFFAALREEAIIDKAMATARRAIGEREDWWAPVLFSRLRSGRTYYKPEFTERGEETWQDLDLNLRTGNLTPVLGPGLADSILGSRQDIARRWVRRWQMPIAPNMQGNLAQVAQYLRVRHAPGTARAQLQDHLKEEVFRRMAARAGEADSRPAPATSAEIDPETAIVELGRDLRLSDPGDPYRVMAAVPAKVYVTTGWTDLLQMALREREPSREPVTLVFPWKDSIRAKALRDKPTIEQPLVYHLFGRLEDPRSLVLSEDDYFDWLIEWVKRRKNVPPVVRAALTSKSLLFLGYRLDDWDFRVVFQSIKSFEGSFMLQDNVHVGVQLSPENQLIDPEAAQEYLESYFGRDKVSIYWGDARRFLDELRARTNLQT